jgi:ABC-2 type transport system ATP-binding protein
VGDLAAADTLSLRGGLETTPAPVLMTPVISVTDLHVAFSQGFRRPPFTALERLSMRVDKGEIVGILGPNGSGKTTLLRVLAGLLRPKSGTATVLDREPSDRALVRRVGYQPEGAMPFPTLSGVEFLHYMGDLMQLPASTTRDAAAVWLARLGLGDTGAKRIRDYSTGMRRRLALAVALLSDPEVLLLDEPTSGLDPDGSLLVMEILAERAAAGTTVLLASHHLQEIEQTCGRIYLLSGGRVVSEGTLDDLLGTGESHLVVRHLDAAGFDAVEAVVRQSGGEVVRRGEEREHLFALFRRMREGSTGGGE